MFVLGVFCCGVFIYLLSCFIWNIQIDGNQSVSRQMVLEYLSGQEIGYGTRKGSIDCKALAASLRSEFSDFAWVSVKIKGTGLFVDVQEGTDVRILKEREYEDSDLIADADGEIVSMITRNGTPKVTKGDTVSIGDVLVLGRLAITDDGGEVVNYHYCAADADIYIRTDIPYHDEFSLEHEVLSYTGQKRFGGYLKIFGVCLGIPAGFASFPEYDILKEEHRLKLLQDFYLPFSVTAITAREYQTELRTYTREEAIDLANRKLQKFLLQKEEKGVQIFEKNVKIELSATSCCASGTISVVQKAGRRVRTDKIDPQQE